MRKLSLSWQDLSDEQWQEACRREAVIRPLAEQDAVSRQATAAAAEQLGIGPARRRVGNRATWQKPFKGREAPCICYTT